MLVDVMLAVLQAVAGPPAEGQTQPTESVRAAELQVDGGKPPDSETPRICRVVQETGSRVRRRRVCISEAESRDMQHNFRDAQSRASTQPEEVFPAAGN
jgi:hypothetical protein